MYLFRAPARIVIIGASGTGKSTIIKQIVKNSDTMFDQKPEKIFVCRVIETADSYEHPAVVYIQGPPDADLLKGNNGAHIIVCIEDAMEYYQKKPLELSALFTRYSHHCNATLIMTFQSAFSNSRMIRTNATHIILTKTISDRLTPKIIGRQMYPENTKFFENAYRKATDARYGYLLIDSHPDTEDEVRLCTDIFEDVGYSVFKPKSQF